MIKSIIYLYSLFFNFRVMGIKSSKLYSLYLAIVSFVALVAIAINLGIVLTSLGQYFIITDDEYLQNREYYKIEQCENTKKWVDGKETKIEKTPEEIETCKQQVVESVSASRSYNIKEMFISSGAWFIVFLGVFLFHYPKFIRDKN